MTTTWTEICADLARRIAGAEYAPGDTLPDVDTLTGNYHVQESTVRRALHQLAAEGVITLSLRAVVTPLRQQNPGTSGR